MEGKSPRGEGEGGIDGCTNLKYSLSRTN